MSINSCEVGFYARRSDSPHCFCDACNKEGFVIKMTVPVTKQIGYQCVTTQYTQKQLCEDCIRKLLDAVSCAGGVSE